MILPPWSEERRHFPTLSLPLSCQTPARKLRPRLRRNADTSMSFPSILRMHMIVRGLTISDRGGVFQEANDFLGTLASYRYSRVHTESAAYRKASFLVYLTQKRSQLLLPPICQEMHTRLLQQFYIRHLCQASARILIIVCKAPSRF